MSTEAFTLYGYAGSPFCLAVEIALHECRAKFKRHDLDPQTPKTKVFLKKSLFGRVPLLVGYNHSGDFSILETPAVLLYLAERFKESDLYLQDFYLKSEIFSWMSFLDGEFGELVLRVFEPSSCVRCPASEISLLENYLHTLDRYLSSRAFLVGAYSVADILAVPFLDVIAEIPGFDLNQFPWVRSWHERLRCKPGYKVMMKNQQQRSLLFIS